MSALARYFRACGYQVAGYDRTPSPLTDRMQSEEGMSINYRDAADEIALEFRDPRTTLVVYTPAIPTDSCQEKLFLQAGSYY